MEENISIIERSKVIITGENAVVFGASSLACSINAYNSCILNKWDNRYFRIEINHIVAEFDINQIIDAYNNLIIFQKQKRFDLIKEYINKNQLLWIRAILGYFYLNISTFPFFYLKIDLFMPLGSGVGGSSTCTLLTIKSILKLLGLKLTVEQHYEISFMGDKFAHGGNASGTDSAAIAFGGFISYNKDFGVERINAQLQLPFILCHSGQFKQSGKSLEYYRKIESEYPQYFSELIDHFDQITRKCINIIKVEKELNELGKLMNESHALQKSMNVSTVEIDRIVDLCLKNGALGAKLTGGGCGGIVLILCELVNQNKIICALEKINKKVYLSNSN